MVLIFTDNEQLNKDIKNSIFKIIPNAGHEINIDAPEEFANIIKLFLESEEISI